MRRVLRDGKAIGRLGVKTSLPGVEASVRHAATLVRAERDHLHALGGFGLVEKRGTKLPPFALQALACLARRPGWIVVEKRLGKGPYAGRAFRVVWIHSKVLELHASGVTIR
jgi:hypothetical protein